ncbi:LysR family transcriptional regulator [Janthinobacterium agaricidamnosum]|nr:LysR family transcriptional regulator [Janthinobacterium agaricidamnosum]
MKTSAFDGVEAFLAVAELKSFTTAAARLGITPTAVSKAVKLLEQRHGVILFQRTTRNVALTEAGLSLFAGMRPAAAQIGDAFAALNAYRDRPSGTLRLTVPRALGALVMQPLASRMRQNCPDVKLDISLDDGTVDLVEQGYDAGIRLGQSVAQDMVAIRLTPDLSWSVVGAPSYFAAHGRPATPEQLVRHETIRYRFLTSGTLPRWKFIEQGQAFHVETSGGLIVNDTTLIAHFARQGLGLAYMADMEIAGDVAAGRLERVLESYIPATPGLYLYFPVRTQHQPKLRALIDLAAQLAY